MRATWADIGLRARLALAIGALVLASFGAVFVAVRAEMADEAGVISREEAREPSKPPSGEESEGRPSLAPISDARAEVEQTFLIVGGIALAAALLGGYLIAARATSPLRRMAATAEEVSAGDLTPRLDEEPEAAPELRALIAGFNRMLERLDLAFSRRRRFFADASHELRTPLTAVRGQLEVLAREGEPSADEVRRVEALALAELERMELLVEEMLALARFDEEAAIELSTISVDALLSALAGADPANPELGELESAKVRANPDLLTRAVGNLLANARLHAGMTGRVQLSATATADSVTIAVDDDGPGIPAAERERVFERFHRVGTARDRDSGGSGLGLAIAREIVLSHGGRIWIEDSQLGGARVAFELPRFSRET